MAIDPQFITIDHVEDFAEIGGETELEPALRARLDSARLAPWIQYAEVRRIKHIVLRRCFARFRETEWRAGTRRAAAFRSYKVEQAWWLDEYALFRALHACHEERAWTEWSEPLRSRRPDALAAAREELADEILFREYVQ